MDDDDDAWLRERMKQNGKFLWRFNSVKSPSSSFFLVIKSQRHKTYNNKARAKMTTISSHRKPSHSQWKNVDNFFMSIQIPLLSQLSLGRAEDSSANEDKFDKDVWWRYVYTISSWMDTETSWDTAQLSWKALRERVKVEQKGKEAKKKKIFIHSIKVNGPFSIISC